MFWNLRLEVREESWDKTPPTFGTKVRTEESYNSDRLARTEMKLPALKTLLTKDSSLITEITKENLSDIEFNF